MNKDFSSHEYHKAFAVAVVFKMQSSTWWAAPVLGPVKKLNRAKKNPSFLIDVHTQNIHIYIYIYMHLYIHIHIHLGCIDHTQQGSHVADRPTCPRCRQAHGFRDAEAVRRRARGASCSTGVAEDAPVPLPY